MRYVRALEAAGRYQLTIWPYHAMLGGIGHALVSAVEEAIFFHGIARRSQPAFQVKGDNPLTEHYSVLGPEVGDRRQRGARRPAAVDFDAVVIAGQAKSHCVAWTIDDLLDDVAAPSASTCSRTALRRSSSPASSTSPSRRTRRRPASQRRGVTSSARPTRSPLAQLAVTQAANSGARHQRGAIWTTVTKGHLAVFGFLIAPYGAGAPRRRELAWDPPHRLGSRQARRSAGTTSDHATLAEAVRQDASSGTAR